MGSVYGTYLKIGINERLSLKVGHDLIIGTHIHLNIQRISPSIQIEQTIAYRGTFYKYLLKEIMKNATVMVGLSEEDHAILEAMYENYSVFLDDAEFNQLELEKKHEFHIPYLKLSFVTDNLIPDFDLQGVQPRT